MRTLQVLGPSTGGIRRHVATLVDGLAARAIPSEVAGPPGVMSGLLDDQHAVPVSLGPRAPQAVAAVRRLARGVDVVHAHGLTAGWIASSAVGRRRVVVTIHNLVLDEAAGSRAGLLRRLEGWLPSRCAATIVISPEMEARFGAGSTDRAITRIPPVGPVPTPTRGPDEVRAELRVPDGVPLVVLVGRLHPQKDISTLLRAVAELDRPLQVAIVGEGPERATLEDERDRLGVADRVTFVGAKPNGADYLAAADLVVMCSLWEGFGLVVAEALHLERPVVATDVGPVSSMVRDGETGRLVPPGDPGALRAAMAEVLADPAGAATMARSGAMLVAEHFSPEVLIDDVVSVYRTVVEEQ